MALLDRVKARLPTSAGEKEALLDELILDATDAVKAYLGRDSVPAPCESAVVRLTIIQYNRLGMEGETSHSEGGISVGVEALPDDVKAMLRPYRLIRTVAK